MIDRLAIVIFSFYARLKGYKVERISSATQKERMNKLIHEVHVKELKWVYSKEIETWSEKHYEKAISFVVYHKNELVGTMSLLDPKYANRLYEGYGINENLESFELGGLAVDAAYRSKNMLIFLILLKDAYVYSKKHGIKYWLALSSRLLYNNIVKFDPTAELVKKSTKNGKTRMGILYHDSARKVNPGHVCYRMTVASFSPRAIALQFVKNK